MTKPKLFFVNRFYRPNESATAQLLSDLCATLSARDWDVHVITSDRGNPGQPRLARNERLDGVTIRRVWSTQFGVHALIGRVIDYLSFYPGAFVELLRTVGRGDIVIVKTDPPMFVLLAVIAAKYKRARIAAWLQDLYPEVAIELGFRWLRGPLGAALIALRNRALRAVDAAVVVGIKMGDRLADGGIERSKIYLLPNWSDDQIKPLPVAKSHSRSAWGIEQGAFVFGYSGNFGRAHESETILRAAKLLEHRRDIFFLFVGDGHESHYLKRAITIRKLESFLFQPHQPRDQLSDSLAAADAHWLSLRPELEGLIVPSKFYGIASAGRPVVAIVAKDGEIAKVIDELQCGYVVEPGDGQALADVIVRLADDQPHREELGKNARAGSQAKFTRALALNRWEWILENLARPPRPSLPHHRNDLADDQPIEALLASLSDRAADQPPTYQSLR